MKRINELTGMTTKDLNTLKRMMNVNVTSFENKIETVAEYISNHNVKTETRTSKKGVELVKVFFESGIVKEYPINQINKTLAFDY